MRKDAAEGEFQRLSCLQFSNACISSKTFRLKIILPTVNQALGNHSEKKSSFEQLTFGHTIEELRGHWPKSKQITVKSMVQIIGHDASHIGDYRYDKA